MCFIYNGANEVVDIVFLAWGGGIERQDKRMSK